MAKVKIQGHASGTGVFTLTSPNSNTDRTITLPDADVTLGTDATKMPLSGGAFTGAVTTNSTFDGVDIATRDAVLTSTTTTANNALPLAGGTMTGQLNLNSHLDMGDNHYIALGASDDFQIYHDGNNSYIKDTGTGDLLIRGSNNLKLQSATGEDMVVATTDDAVNLYFDNTLKFATTNTGIKVTGGVAIGGTGTANTLDDYETGTWTPVYTVTGGGSHSSVSAGNAGTYTKIGRTVTIAIYSYIVQTSGTITGYNVSLPFAAGNYPSSGMGIEFGHSGHGQKLQVNHNSSTMNITKYDGSSPMQNAYFQIGITYQTA